MKKAIRKFIYLVFNILMLIYNYFFPRNENIWVTGKTTGWYDDFEAPSFFDNSKYLFIYLSKEKNVKVYWLTKSKKEYSLIKNYGLNVLYFPSIKSIYIVLRAKYAFHHYGINQINPLLQLGMTQIDLWHGTPIKKIRYDVVNYEEPKLDLLKKIIDINIIEYVASTSKYLSSTILSNAFKVEMNRMLNYGYPRTDIFKLNKNEIYEFCKKYSRELINYLDISKQFRKVLLYMPTFRDDDPYYFEKSNIDFEKFNNTLKNHGDALFIKLHPLTKSHKKMVSLSNIFFINNDVDIYPFLVYTDVLITDYSSIMFDYLLLNKEMFFIPYDFDKYIKNRELYYDYYSLIPGKMYHNTSEFLDDYNNIYKYNFSEKRNNLKNLMIENYHYDACNNICKHFNVK